jgi:proline utilization trans-activator
MILLNYFFFKAPFGFFDLDALFSVAFIFVLAESVPSDIGSRRGAHDLKTAMDIFDYLGERGNKASLQRKMEIEQMCNHIGVSVQERNVLPGPVQTRSSSTQQVATPPQTGMNRTPHATIRDLEQTLDDTSGYPLPSLQISEQPPRWENDINLDDTFSGSDPRDVYTIYQSNDLMLSGSVELDWEERERQLLVHQ